jgi:hypothetical protein
MNLPKELHHPFPSTCYFIYPRQPRHKQFSVKGNGYNLEHTLKLNDYKIIVRPDGDQYLEMAIAFNTNRMAVTLSIPRYVSKMLTRFRPQYLEPSFASSSTHSWLLYRSNLRQQITANHTPRQVFIIACSADHRTPGHHRHSIILRTGRGSLFTTHR